MVEINRKLARKLRHDRARICGIVTRPRLCVFRSGRHIYAQVIDDSAGHTLASAGTLEPEMKDKLVGKTKTQRAELIGAAVAERALKNGISKVVFDRGGCKYHGRVKALAEAARKGGLEF